MLVRFALPHHAILWPHEQDFSSDTIIWDILHAASVGLDRMVGHGGAAVDVRRRQDRYRGAAVPDRLPDDYGGGGAGGHGAVPAGLSEPGGAPEPEWGSAESTGAGHGAADGQDHRVVAVGEGVEHQATEPRYAEDALHDHRAATLGCWKTKAAMSEFHIGRTG